MKKDTPNFVNIVALTVATLFFWVLFSIYQAFLDEANVQIEPAVLEDISPTLDSQTLTLVDQRIYIEEPELSNLVNNVESSVGVVIENQNNEVEGTPATTAATLENEGGETSNTGNLNTQ